MSFPRSRLSRFLFQARRWIAAPTAALMLAGCASTTEITTRHSNDEGTAPARSLLLVAQSPEPATRRVWEEVCQPIFQSNALSVHLAHQVRPVWYEDGGKQALLRWLRDQPAAWLMAILATPPPKQSTVLNITRADTPSTAPTPWIFSVPKAPVSATTCSSKAIKTSIRARLHSYCAVTATGPSHRLSAPGPGNGRARPVI